MTSNPQRIFIEITTKCNLRCRLCHLWKSVDLANKLAISEKLLFLKEVFEWKEVQNNTKAPPCVVILTGGEPFLFPNQVFQLSKFCKNRNVDCYINSNGSLLNPHLREIMDSGLKALTLSIDSHKGVIHASLRGMSGLFESLIRLIKKFNQLKADSANIIPPKLCVQSILGNLNLSVCVLDLVQFHEKV
jgi:MoaA/NifB/PqqE/SkfB family radical SAM enzyme